MGSIVVGQGDLRKCSATDLRRTLVRAKKHEYLPEHIYVAAEELDEFDEEYAPVEPVYYLLRDDESLAIEVLFEVPHDVDPFDFEPELVKALTPYMNRSGAADVQVAGTEWLNPRVSFTVSLRGRTMGDLFDVGAGAHLLVTALVSRTPARLTTRDLLLAGPSDLLIGMPESEWFDAKTDHYIYGRGEEGRIKLARAVAQFCNGEYGGLVVVGVRARGKHGSHGEWVTEITPVPVDGRTRRQYRDALEKHLFPLPVGLEIDVIEAPGKPGRGLVVVSLPPQPEELKPYLVHGAFVAGKSAGSFFTIITRSGEDGLPMHPSEVHNMLVTGRALLRHGLSPGRSNEATD